MNRTLPLFFAAFAAIAQGCSDSPATPDAAAPDVITQPDAVTQPDALPSAPMARTIALSAIGHDRFFGVTYDSRGNAYAVGPVADSTMATADQRSAVVRFTPDGREDASFGMQGRVTVNMVTGTTGEVARGIVIQPSGKIVIAGTLDAVGAMDARDRNIGLMRLNADGSTDTTFGTNGLVTLDLSAGELVGTTYVTDTFWGLTMYPDGRLLVTGAQKRMGGTDTDFALVRLTLDGARDMGFGTAGVFTLDVNNRDATPRTSSVLPDGSTITAGYMSESSVVRPVIFKLTAAGALDRSYGTDGVFSRPVLGLMTEAYAAALQGTNLVTAGYGRDNAMESIDWVSLRLTPAGALDSTYGTTGYARLDLARFNDNCRTLVVLPDNRVFLVGGGRRSETNSDGMVGMLLPNGARDSSFGTNGLMTFDLGGGSDFFWGAAISPSGNQIAVVGAKGVGTAEGNDDAAVLFIPVSR